MAEEVKNILEEDLSPEAEQALRERLEAWKEEVYSNRDGNLFRVPKLNFLL